MKKIRWRSRRWIAFKTYLKALPGFVITLTLFSLVIILLFELLWNDPSKSKPVCVNIGLQMSYATLASVLFYLITLFVPQQSKKIKYYGFVQNTTSHLHIAVSDYFCALAGLTSQDRPQDFFRMGNLKSVMESAHDTARIFYGNGNLRFEDPYHCLHFVLDSVEKKASRLVGLSDILSERAMNEVGMVLTSIQNIRKCNFSVRTRNMGHLAGQVCQLYMYTYLLYYQLYRDMPANMLTLYMDSKDAKDRIVREYHEMFTR